MSLRRVVAAATATVVVAAGATACSGHHLKPGEARLVVDGRAAVAGRNGVFHRVKGQQVIHDGDRVRVDEGAATVALGRGGRLEMRSGTSMQLADPVVLQAGDLLVEPDRRAVSVASDDAQARVETGSAKVSRTLAFTVTAYRGRSVVASPGGTDLTVKAPREAGVPARGVVPQQAVPASCDDDDAWSRRFLAAPCDLGLQLQSAGAGLVAQLPSGEGHTPGFFRLLVPALEQEPALDAVLDPARDPSDNLIASVIAVNAPGRDTAFADRWHAMFGFRDQGASNWGLVALDQSVTDAGPLNSGLDQAIGRAPKRFAAAFSPTGSGAGGNGLGPAGGALSGGGRAGGSNGGGAAPPGPPSASPAPPPPGR